MNQSTVPKNWPTVAEQEAYWREKDHGGNFIPDRVKANEERYGLKDYDAYDHESDYWKEEYQLAPDEERDAYINDQSSMAGEGWEE